MRESQICRGFFAKVCNELDLQKPILPGVMIGEGSNAFWKRFEYEGLPTIFLLW